MGACHALLTKEQRTIVRDADQRVMNQTEAEHKIRCKETLTAPSVSDLMELRTKTLICTYEPMGLTYMMSSNTIDQE